MTPEDFDRKALSLAKTAGAVGAAWLFTGPFGGVPAIGYVVVKAIATRPRRPKPPKSYRPGFFERWRLERERERARAAIAERERQEAERRRIEEANRPTPEEQRERAYRRLEADRDAKLMLLARAVRDKAEFDAARAPIDAEFERRVMDLLR